MARERRRLAAIVAVDVVGYSRLMGMDESGTVVRLREHRRQRLEPAIARHGGRLVKLIGDGALVEFPSAVDALGAAIEFQQAVADANRGQPAISVDDSAGDTTGDTANDTALVFRAGLHLGDLIVDGDDLYGDGVNVAARLEAEAPPGGIVISRATHEAVAGRLKVTFDELGPLVLKNIERPVEAFRVRWEPADWQSAAPADVIPLPADGPLPLPDKPSVAVLPFQNMSGDPEAEYFVDGICEDLTTALSLFSSLFVIARNSAFAYKGRAVDVREAARELGVQYVLEGSGRIAGKRARIHAQLIDAVSGVHIWAERYDVVVEDVFDVQEDITRRIVATVAPKLEAAQVSKVRRARPTHFGAYGLALRAWADAMQAYQRVDSKLRDDAIAQAEAALRLDPRCGRAWSTLAFAYWQHANFRTGLDPAVAVERAIDAGTRALEIDREDYMAQAYRGAALLTGLRFEEGLADMREAWRINPNDVSTLIALGWAEITSGDTASGTQRLREALRLSPRDPQQFNIYTCLGGAAFIDADYARGIEVGVLGKRQQANYAPNLHYLALNYAGSGDLARARAEIDLLRRIAPEWLDQRLAGYSALVRPADRARSLELLRRAAGVAP